MGQEVRTEAAGEARRRRGRTRLRLPRAERGPRPRPVRAAPARPSRPAGRRRSARGVISDGDDAEPGTVSGGSGSTGREGGLETGPFSSISIVGRVGRPEACTLPTAGRKRRMDSIPPVTSVGWSNAGTAWKSQLPEAIATPSLAALGMARNDILRGPTTDGPTTAGRRTLPTVGQTDRIMGAAGSHPWPPRSSRRCQNQRLW